MYDWEKCVEGSHHARRDVEDRISDEIASPRGIFRKQGVGCAVLLKQVF